MKGETTNTRRQESSIMIFLTSLLVGAAGIYFGAMFVLGVSNFTLAITVALIGAIIWGITGFFAGWIPLVGPILTFVAWLAAVNILYSTTWIAALQIAVLAWIVSAIVLYILSLAGVTEARAIGVPGR